MLPDKGVIPVVANIFLTKAWKSHRITDFTFLSPNVWTDIPWEVRVEDETTPGITFYAEGSPSQDLSIVVIGYEALYYVGGCIRPEWTGGGAASVIVASRIVTSINSGVTWVEARCLQSVNARSFQTNEVGTQHYIGSILAKAGTWVKLQAQVANTDMILSGWAGFDNPVSATLSMHSV
jgi:hypothetical protein